MEINIEDTRHKVNVKPTESTEESKISVDTVNKRVIHKRHNTTTVRHQSNTPKEDDNADV